MWYWAGLIEGDLGSFGKTWADLWETGRGFGEIGGGLGKVGGGLRRVKEG